jgi:hypothetical protein
VPYTEYGINNSNACCGTGPYGTVFVYDLGGGTLQFDVTLANNWYFIGSGPAFAFDLSNVAKVAYSSVTTGWTPQSGTQTPGSIQLDHQGTFMFGVTPPNSGGSPPGNGQKLSFDVTATDTVSQLGITLANIELADAVGNNPQNYFGIDFGTCSGTGANFSCSPTGYAGAGSVLGSGNQNPPGSTPLPAALPLFASGLGLIGFFGSRRKRRTNQSLAA